MKKLRQNPWSNKKGKSPRKSANDKDDDSDSDDETKKPFVRKHIYHHVKLVELIASHMPPEELCVRDQDGYTPLMCQCSWEGDHVEAVMFLVSEMKQALMFLPFLE